VRDESPTIVVCGNCEGDRWKVHHLVTNVCPCGAVNVLVCAACTSWCCAGCNANAGPSDA